MEVVANRWSVSDDGGNHTPMVTFSSAEYLGHQGGSIIGVEGRGGSPPRIEIVQLWVVPPARRGGDEEPARP